MTYYYVSGHSVLLVPQYHLIKAFPSELILLEILYRLEFIYTLYVYKFRLCVQYYFYKYLDAIKCYNL